MRDNPRAALSGGARGLMAADEVRGLMRAGESIRTGIHLGDVAVGSDGDLYGDGVDTTQRIQTLAQPGQIVVSGDVWLSSGTGPRSASSR